MYAAGKIPGSFFKREGRSGEKGTLTARMIDRPIRPLFPKGWHFETQLVAIPLSIDHVHPYDILAMNGASAALMISDVPLPTPVGAVRIGKIDGNFVVNPTEEDAARGADLDLIVAGTEEAILMVEAGANEIPEAEILDALDIAHDAIKKLCAAQRELAEKAGKAKLEIEAPQVDADLLRPDPGVARRRSSTRRPRSRTSSSARTRRRPSRRRSLEQYSGDPDADTYAEFRQRAQLAFDKLEKQTIRQRIAVHKKRPDGRGEHEIRQITIEVGAAAAHARLGALHARPDAGAVASRRWARSRRRCASTRSGSRPRSTTGTTTTSRRSRWARRASCAAPSGVTSVTARWPSARWCR